MPESVDPLLLRKVVQGLTGRDTGANPSTTDGSDIQVLPLPVFPVVATDTPLNVMPRGWWSGGVVNNNSVESAGNNASGFLVTQTIVTDSTDKNGVSLTAGTGLNLRTVTAGKKFYLTSFSFDDGTAGTTLFILTDGGVSGTKKFIGGAPANTPQQYTFPTPIQFSTNVFIDMTATSTTLRWSYNGYEEGGTY